jgi:hypothetical protein
MRGSSGSSVRPSTFPAQRLDGGDEAAVLLQGLRNALRRHPEVLGEQAIAQPADRGLQARIAARFDRDVAFGVEPHRAIAEIRRSDGEELVVDDEHLAVHVEAALAAQARHLGAVGAETPMRVGGGEPAMQARAQHAHRRLLEPSRLGTRRHEHYVGALRFAQARRQHVAHRVGAEVLVFHERVPARRAERIEVQLTQLGDPARAVVRRFGARDRDVDVGHFGRAACRPRIVVATLGERWCVLAAGAPPPVAAQLAQRTRASPSTTAPTSWKGPYGLPSGSRRQAARRRRARVYPSGAA